METTMNTTHSKDTPTDEAPGHVQLRLASITQTLSTSATLAMNEAVAKRRAASRTPSPILNESAL